MATMSEKLRSYVKPGFEGLIPSERVRAEAADLMDEMAKALEDDVALLEQHYPCPARNGEIARSRAILARFREAG